MKLTQAEARWTKYFPPKRRGSLRITWRRSPNERFLPTVITMRTRMQHESCSWGTTEENLPLCWAHNWRFAAYVVFIGAVVAAF